MPRFKPSVHVGGARRGGLAASGRPRLHMSLCNPPARNLQIVLFEGTLVATEAGMGGTRTIYINKKQVSVAGSPLTADEILTAGGYDPKDYSLFLVPRLNAGGSGQPGQAGGGDNNNNGAGGQPGQTVEIKKGQAISISDGLHFNAILKNVPYGFT